MPTPSLEDVQTDLDTLAPSCPVTVTDVLVQTDKSVLATGLHGRQAVVVKMATGNDTFWQAKLAHEAEVYSTFSEHPPPITVPRLIHTDGARMLILERVAGQPLDVDRYPTRRFAGTEIGAVLATLRMLNSWHPPAGAFAPVFDYPERVERYRAKGILTDEDARALHELLATCAEPGELNHGDPLPSNLLITPDRTCVPLDWEFTGLFLPGFDLAMLHALLAHTPAALRQIESTVATAGGQVPFVINQAMVLTRELRTHRELSPGALRDNRLQLIDRLWADTRHKLHQLTAGKDS